MAINVVQSASTVPSGNVTSLDVVLGKNTVAGNLLFVAFSSGSTSATLSLDSADTWTALEGSPLSVNTKMGSWYAINIVGGKTTYTFTRSSSGVLCATLVEISGCQSSPFDVSHSATGTFTSATATAASGSTASSAQADEIWLCGLNACSDTGVGTAAPTFTLPIGAGDLRSPTTSTRPANTACASAVVSRIVSAVGTASNTCQVNYNASAGTDNWYAIIAAFKAVPDIGISPGTLKPRFVLFDTGQYGLGV